jgi:DNA-directed RNA polymerase specialized sigma24 family protein
MSASRDVRSDAELLAAAGSDSRAFRELYDRHAARLHSFFRQRTADDDIALDLTAETFAQAWFSRRRFRDRRDGSAAPWLFGIARNVLHRSVQIIGPDVLGEQTYGPGRG